MNYMSRLDAARRHLVAGEFLEAEEAYWRACREWERSRFRAPLTEKAVEPLLRWGGGIFGRDRGRAALTTFTEREQVVRSDLEEVARLMSREAAERAGEGSELDPEEVQGLERALAYQVSSRIFRLPRTALWPVTRAYLHGCEVHGLPIEPTCLPAELKLSVDDLEWLMAWARRQLDSTSPELRSLSPWLLRTLTDPDLDARIRGIAATLASRLCLLDPLGAPRALELGRQALQQGPDPAEAAAVLRLVTALTCNESRLATGWVSTERWRELEDHARRLDAPWPAPELVEVLRRRGAGTWGSVAAMAWSGEREGCLLVLRLEGAAPSDALLLEPRENPEGEPGPFVCARDQAREALDTWLPSNAPILCDRTPPAWVESAVAGRPIVGLSPLEAILAPDQPLPSPEAPVAPHPVFDEADAVAASWRPLVDEARSLAPRLWALTASAPFRAEWGRENLERLGRAGVEVAANLSACVRAVWPTVEAPPSRAEELQEVGGVARLVWPRLSQRLWPRGREAVVPDRLAAGDLLLARRPSPAELAGLAARVAPCAVVVEGSERGEEVAMSVAALVDPASVTLAPAAAHCVEPVLQLLDGWIEAAGADATRGADILWLYRALCTAPEGDVARWLGEGGSERARSDVDAVLRRSSPACPDHCRLQASDGCFGLQREERRAAGLVWIEPWSLREGEATQASTLVIDDPVHHLGGLDEASSQRQLKALSRQMAAADRVIVWVDAAPFARAVQREFNRLLPRNRPLRLVQTVVDRRLALYVCPPGYAPGSVLMGEEAESLTAARLSLWGDRPGAKAIWSMPDDPASRWEPSHGSIPMVDGAALRPQVETVLVPRLSRDGAQDPLLALLRLAAAATHATHELVALDPRLAETSNKLLGPTTGVEELVPPGALVRPGSVLLGELPARRVRHWRRPITKERLRRLQDELGDTSLDETARQDLASLLAGFAAGNHLVLGGLRHREREIIALLVARMAAECKDAGPLGVRLVIWIGDNAPQGADRVGAKALSLTAGRDGLEHGLVAADRGRLQLLVVPPSLLADPVLERWAQRNQEVLWVVGQAERTLADHPLGTLGHVGTLARVAQLGSTSGSGVLAFVDDPREEKESWLSRAADGLDARAAARVAWSTPGHSWRWLRTPIPDPSVTCGRCEASATLRHAYQLCDRCGGALVRGRSDLEAAQESILEGTCQWLQQHGPHHPWLIVAADMGERDRLRTVLGLDPGSWASEPLLGPAERASAPYLQDVVTAEELWQVTPRGTELLFTRVPSSRALLDAVLDRLGALGWKEGIARILDHPLQWDEHARADEPASLAASGVHGASGVHWRVSRPEVEFRCRESLAALGRSLRGRVAAGSDLLGGLGPHANPDEDPRLARLCLAVEVWGGARGASLRNADSQRQQTMLRAAEIDIGRCIDELERQGIVFEDRRARALHLDRLGRDRLWRRGAAYVVAWFLEEGLLERVSSDSVARAGTSSSSRPENGAWLEVARASELEEPCELPARPKGRVVEPSPVSAVSTKGEPGWVLGIAGSGKTHHLVEQSAAAVRAGRPRVLALVPGGSGLLTWQRLREEGVLPAPVEVATAAELGLAFLRHHHELGGLPGRPRVMPDAGTEEGLRIRERLLRETSRRYAIEVGGVPPVDMIVLRRILEGGEVWSEAVAGGGEALDAKVLTDCARAARFEAGWINDSDLHQLARQWLIEHPYVAEAWRDRYATVLVDDVESLHPDQLAFVDRMFPAVERWTSADPLLVHPRLRPQRVPVDNTSRRLPRELARAARDLLFPVHRDRATPLSTRRRERGTLVRQHVLNLEGCASFLEARRATGSWNGTRVAVVTGHRGDLQRLSARLRESGAPVWPAREVFRACAPGPRQLLAVLLLAEGLDRLDVDTATPLVRALLLASPHAHAAGSAPKLARRLVRWSHGADLALHSPAEAFLQPLLDLSRQVQEIETLEAAAKAVRRTHLLVDLLRSDAAAGRLGTYVEEHARRPWRAVVRGVDPKAVADPLGRGDHLWMMEIDDLPGSDFDHIVYLCTGHEPAEQHYRVLGKARESLTVLYSEIDPFGSSR